MEAVVRYDAAGTRCPYEYEAEMYIGVTDGTLTLPGNLQRCDEVRKQRSLQLPQHR